MHHYPLGGMEDVLRTTLATYMPQRTGDEHVDRQRIVDFADEVREIIYRMRGIRLSERSPVNNPGPDCRWKERIMETLCSVHPANIIDESDIEYRESLYEELRRRG